MNDIAWKKRSGGPNIDEVIDEEGRSGPVVENWRAGKTVTGPFRFVRNGLLWGTETSSFRGVSRLLISFVIHVQNKVWGFGASRGGCFALLFKEEVLKKKKLQRLDSN